jgi:hypothetical protein
LSISDRAEQQLAHVKADRATSRVTNQVPVLFPPCNILLLLKNWVRGGCSKLWKQPARTDLVTAVRKGHWVVLVELNLAPSEVLEMLDRLLDDNRELMVPDTQEVIKPHPDFAIFATQNPTGVYVCPCSPCVRASSQHDSVINLMPLLLQAWGPQTTFKGFQKQISRDARRGNTRL